MRILPVFLLVTGLGACGTSLPTVAPPVAGSTTVAPRAVTLFRDTVTARMSDGQLCTAVREGRSGPWRATFSGCPHGWGVAVDRPSPRPRLPLVRVAADPWVTLTAPQGALGYGPRR